VSFLLDTDICSAHLKGNASISARLLQYTGRLHVSVLTVSELYTWAKRAAAPPKRIEAILDLLMAVQPLDVDRDVARTAGELRATLLDRGQPMASMDLHIAATAIVHGLTLVTHNVRHFASVPNMPLEDWLTQ
jgi:tRNA(fMet)-specific endonuclease VapC